MKELKKILIGSFLFSLVLLVGCQVLPNDENTEEGDIITIEELAELESLDRRLKESYQPDRSTYGYGTIGEQKFLIADSLKNLPPLPDDFWRVKWAIMTGKVEQAVLLDMGPEYYEQPEFLGETFVDVCIPVFYREPDLQHWTPEGYGTFPHQSHTNTRAGSSFTLYSFTHTSCGVERYQGLGIIPIYPSSVELRDGSVHPVNPGETKAYFQVTTSPGDILLTPTYPMYEREWIQRITLDVTVAPDTPPGIYAIGYDVVGASQVNEEVWAVEYKEKYQTKGFVSVTEPQFIVAVVVEG